MIVWALLLLGTGGWCLHLVRQVSEQASYQRVGNYNVVRLTLRIPTEETGP